MGWSIETGVRRIHCSITARSRNRLVTPTDEKKSERKKAKKPQTATKKKRCSLCGLSVFGVKRELKEIAWRTVFQLKIPCLSCIHLVVRGFKALLFALCSNLCKACASLLCSSCPPPFFPPSLCGSGLDYGHMQGDAFSDHFTTASPKILLILLFQAYNYCRRQSILLLSAAMGVVAVTLSSVS